MLEDFGVTQPIDETIERTDLVEGVEWDRVKVWLASFVQRQVLQLVKNIPAKDNNLILDTVDAQVNAQILRNG